MRFPSWRHWTRVAALMLAAAAVWLAVHELRHFTLDK